MVKLFPTQALGTPYIRQIQGPIDDMDLVAVGGSTARTCVFF
jgi:2-keto-3-deoxy-6-phosphogluconate aldolase